MAAVSSHFKMTKDEKKNQKGTTKNVQDKPNTGNEVRLRGLTSTSESSSGGGTAETKLQQSKSTPPNNKKRSSPPRPTPKTVQTPPSKSMGQQPTSETHSSKNGHSDDQDQVPASSSSTTRPQNKCCLCWCCCCSCSCSALKNNQENRAKPKDPDSDLNCDAEVTPSLEEIRSWGESFDKLMRNAAGRKVFREFLKCEYSEENILFWLACEELRKESQPELIEEKARLIYEDYISILSPKEVSLDSRVREIVNQNMVDPSPHTFDEAQVQIYTLMHRDSYPRFVNSIMYKKLAQLNVQHRGSSVSTSGITSHPASRKESLAA